MASLDPQANAFADDTVARLCVAADATQFDEAALQVIDRDARRAGNAHEGIDDGAGDVPSDEEDGAAEEAEPSLFAGGAKAREVPPAERGAADGGDASLDDFLDALETT
jgi:hypothetical protein